jgi:hypothetical protein
VSTRPGLTIRRAKLATFSLRSTARFTEGFDTRDLKEPKALLEELGS